MHSGERTDLKSLKITYLTRNLSWHDLKMNENPGCMRNGVTKGKDALYKEKKQVLFNA